ncbi:bacillithiol biosynthesis deacetylase BshB2 [Virgibacillus sp. NKC19-16]|uniref:bacillithiol biosynthesis deacetylase BshB2 n=1 Tax=Virgibacillus salidurans TaxID=2831673 RepID=UPI001F1B5875|nr:bacillithiol biosynthesis deacetylase BshB2 [Virgibacillus sp. NKC19-16]UJL45317.1 bacillithiol biosynthesis deacetylase BshB2 [Virgibacillus sp. NKC19-16]
MEKHVVIIYPHPDDESFGAAGTITQFRKQGVPVTYLCGTLGEMGRNMGTPPFANRETLPEIRKEELINACKVLDVDLQMLGYRDKTMEYEDRDEVAAHLKGILEKIEPSLVITHYPDYAVHPDHNALGAAAIEAVRLMNDQKRPVVWTQAISNNYQEELGKPDIMNDISNHFDKKMEAIRAHDSQATGVLRQFEPKEQTIDEDIKRRFSTEEFFIWEFED